ncbi:MAG: HIT family protein [Chromatiales bacterium]|nr:HIT family protein [Chromatiales bacterium]
MADLHPRLRDDTVEIGSLSLCRLLLMKDANYPWFILVPDRDGITEIYQLSAAEQIQLLRESSLLARAMAEHFQPDKLNIAALGNIVPQLHVHHIARSRRDSAWPAPVWGRAAPAPYRDAALRAMIEFANGVLAMAPDVLSEKI